MDWCVQPPHQANHAPVAVCNGDATRSVLEVAAAPGADVPLTAASSRDPDGHGLSYRWWVYREAGTYRGDVKLSSPTRIESAVAVPGDAAGAEIHIILEVTDDGAPPLTSFRRIRVRAR